MMPAGVKYIINTLEDNGYEAFVVGGCVRDIVSGIEPNDWDICTSARPEHAAKCFKRHRIIETGLPHGTITLVLDHKPFEITTYRIDGLYSDNRRPDGVEFVNNLRQDLARRDFTINAMAYNPSTGIVDFFGGAKDLSLKIVRCVGDPDKRFKEDALRIMRALRFAAVLGFSIDADTSTAMHNNRRLLHNIAAERIAGELNRLIVGDDISGVLSGHIAIIAELIPEMIPAIGFRQNNPHHCYDVMNHILLSVDAAPKELIIRLAMLFHDIGKPGCYTQKDGVGHFYNHPQICSAMAGDILSRMRYDKKTIEAVTQLILYHDTQLLPRGKNIKRWLNKIGEDMLRRLIEVKRADAKARAVEYRQGQLIVLDEAEAMLDEIIEQRQCFSLRDLAVNGRDLMELGAAEGIELGVMLNRLMDMVIDEQLENDKMDLLKAARKLMLE